MRLRLAIVAALVAALVTGVTSVDAGPGWASAESATIRPGAETVTGGGQCTANFVFTDGSAVYLGQAAHCASTGAPTDTNGCEAGSLPIGTPVEVEGANYPGELAYSSWITMQEEGENDDDTCAYNDFALVRLDSRDVGRVNPSIPFWGGPDGVATTTSEGEKVFSYQNSELRAGITALKPKEGYSFGTDGDGWTHIVATVTPGIPGDSGSAFVNEQGEAFGVLVTINLPGTNGVTDLSRALAYMQSNGGPDVSVVDGTSPFSGGGILP